MSDEILAMAQCLGAACLARGWRVATAESCTGGGVGEAITRVAGSSGWFDRGFVTYSYEAKVEMLGVSSSTLQKFGAVSEETVREMATGAIARSRADLAVAITGIAGPAGATPTKPVGLVWFSWATRDGHLRSFSRQFVGDRAEVREQAVLEALDGLVALVAGKG